MHPRLPILLALLALALLPASASAITNPFPPGSVTILSGNDALDAALPAPVHISYAAMRGAVSDDGRYVAFTSGADGLSTEDDDRAGNVYVKDRTTGAVILASRRNGAQGEPTHGDCGSATISDDGRLVAMACYTESLGGGDLNNHADVYVRDVVAGTTTLVSRVAAGVANGDALEPMISGDGSAVVYSSTATNLDAADANDRSDVYRRSLVGIQATVLVSRRDGAYGVVGDLGSSNPSVSDDGNTVAFASKASNLRLATDNNLLLDVYVRDVNAGTTKLVSAKSGDAEAIGNGDSRSPSISGQEPYRVAFTSDASNFGPTDANGAPDVYVRSLMFDTTLLASRKAAGNEAANGPSYGGGIDDSGANVAFASAATDLNAVATGKEESAYVRHVVGGSTELLSRAGEDGPDFDNGAGAPAVSGDGKSYAWGSEGGGGLPDADPTFGNLYLRDMHGAARTTELVARPPGTEPFVNAGPAASLTWSARTVSADGGRVAFTSARGGVTQAFVRDTRTGALILASRADGPEGAPSTREVREATISADGRRVAFTTNAALHPADTAGVGSAYVRDLETGRTYLASRADGAEGADADSWAGEIAISGDGKRVAFVTNATNLGDGDTTPNYDIHVRDLAAGTTILATPGAGGAPSGGYHGSLALDADGTHLAFSSSTTNLLDEDHDPYDDVYLRDLAAGTTRLVSAPPGGPNGDGHSHDPTISADGTVVAFVTHSPDLGASAGLAHVAVRDLSHDTLVLADRADGAGGPLADWSPGHLSMSADGRSVAWVSQATNLVPDNKSSDGSHVFVRDLAANTTRLVSRDGGGAPSKYGGQAPGLSADGACVAYHTSTPLAPGAGTDFRQVYMRALEPGCVPALPSSGGGGAPGGGAAKDVTAPVLSKVSLKRKRFAVGRRPRGTVLRFGLSEPARVKVRVRRARGSLVRAKGAGAGRLRFSGRLGGRALRAGRHRMVVTATDAAGNRSPRVILRFRIVRGR